MSDTPKEVCWIALDREVAENYAGQDFAVSKGRTQAVIEACRKSMVTECVEVEGEVSELYSFPEDEPTGRFALTLTEEELPADLKGFCRVIVIAGERDG